MIIVARCISLTGAERKPDFPIFTERAGGTLAPKNLIKIWEDLVSHRDVSLLSTQTSGAAPLGTIRHSHPAYRSITSPVLASMVTGTVRPLRLAMPV